MVDEQVGQAALRWQCGYCGAQAGRECTRRGSSVVPAREMHAARLAPLLGLLHEAFERGVEAERSAERARVVAREQRALARTLAEAAYVPGRGPEYGWPQ